MRTQAAALVGRDRELSQLASTLRDSRGGHGVATFLVGEPGVGKTRLATAAIGMAVDAGMVAVRGRGSNIGPLVPFRPLTEVLMSLARRDLLPDLASSGWPSAVLGQLVPELHTEATDAQRASVVVIAEALLRVLSAVGCQGGCLLVLEDLHDVDAETLAIIEYLLDNLHDQPIQLIGTLRHEACAAFDLVSAVRHRDQVGMLEIPRLDRDAVSQLIASWLGTQMPAPEQQVPPLLVDRIVAASAGVPFIVEELLYELSRTGQLVQGPRGWHLHELPSAKVPATVVRSISLRTERLGSDARSVLNIAAVMGRRFALSVVGRVAGMDERTLLSTMHAGVAARLVTPDEPAPDWYAFRHPLTTEALRTILTPTERANLSSEVADAIEAVHPDLPGEWCAHVAELRRAAGDPRAAGQLYARAGRRALANGAVQSAVTMLDLACEQQAFELDPAARADTLESLLNALGETGQVDRALELASMVTLLGDQGLSGTRRAVLHGQIARAAQQADRWVEATKQLDIARGLLGPTPAAGDIAWVDVIAAELQMGKQTPDRLRVSVELAERAAQAADEAGLPGVGCEALQILGALALDVDIGKADKYFERARLLAEQHHSPIMRLNCEAMLAMNRVRVDGSIEAVRRAHQEALRLGAVPRAYEMHSILAMQTVRRGDLDTAASMIDEDLQVAKRLRLGFPRTYLLVTKAVLFANQARRVEMEEVLDELDVDEGHSSYARPVTYGLAQTYCSLLEEDRDRARAELDTALAVHAETPTPLEFGKDGLPVLLGVLAQRKGWPQLREVAAGVPSRTRWNAQSIHLARAVLLGRDGRVTEANQAAEDGLQAAAIYPLTRHLGMRLVAQEAHDHGWGDPVVWLRQAEEFFHRAEIPAVAGACRAMLRQMGAPVRQRRVGTELVPDALRKVGVTAREFDVCRLIADRAGNKVIASRLHISPRTVEKHVASLLTKTKQPDREALTTYARTFLVD